MSRSTAAVTRKDIDEVLVGISTLATQTRQKSDDIIGVIGDVVTQFDGRFTRVEVRLGTLETEQRAIREDIGVILSSLDSFANRLEISDDERQVMAHQLDRPDRWVHNLADRVGVKLRT